MGFILSAAACACRGKWFGTGVLIALAVLSQQFALLVALPLFVLAPATRRSSYAAGAVLSGALVVLPLLLATGGHALHDIALGSGDNPFEGGTVLLELRLSGAPLILVSRVVPLLSSAALSWWVLRRRSSSALDPTILLSVIAISLGLRLACEVSLFGYYFLALSVSLVLLDVTRGHIRPSVIGWLAMVVLVFCLSSFNVVGSRWPQVVTLVIVAFAAVQILRRLHTGRQMWVWLAVLGCAVLNWPTNADPLSNAVPVWLWQVALVAMGLMLAASPLRASLRPREVQELSALRLSGIELEPERI